MTPAAWLLFAAVEQVMVLGIDGLSAEALRSEPTPRLHGLMSRGAFTLQARAVLPTVSSPNWASMIMGAGPAQHGVTSNEWQRDRYTIEPTCRGAEGIFPTIFGLLRKARPESRIGVFHDWDDFGRLVERLAVDEIRDLPDAPATVEAAIAWFRSEHPALTFVHLDHVDHAGHEKGWGSAEYRRAVAEADELVGRVVDGIAAAGKEATTLVLVTSDHGGAGTRHGGLSMQEIEIPWILAGPTVAVGREIRAPVNTYDTAATIAHAFGVEPHPCWIGKPVLEAFSP